MLKSTRLNLQLQSWKERGEERDVGPRWKWIQSENRAWSEKSSQSIYV